MCVCHVSRHFLKIRQSDLNGYAFTINVIPNKGFRARRTIWIFVACIVVIIHAGNGPRFEAKLIWSTRLTRNGNTGLTLAVPQEMVGTFLRFDIDTNKGGAIAKAIRIRHVFTNLTHLACFTGRRNAILQKVVPDMVFGARSRFFVKANNGGAIAKAVGIRHVLTKLALAAGIARRRNAILHKVVPDIKLGTRSRFLINACNGGAIAKAVRIRHILTNLVCMASITRRRNASLFKIIPDMKLGAIAMLEASKLRARTRDAILGLAVARFAFRTRILGCTSSRHTLVVDQVVIVKWWTVGTASSQAIKLGTRACDTRPFFCNTCSTQAGVGSFASHGNASILPRIPFVVVTADGWFRYRRHFTRKRAARPKVTLACNTSGSLGASVGRLAADRHAFSTLEAFASGTIRWCRGNALGHRWTATPSSTHDNLASKSSSAQRCRTQICRLGHWCAFGTIINHRASCPESTSNRGAGIRVDFGSISREYEGSIHKKNGKEVHGGKSI